MNSKTVKRQVKDSVFTNLFKDPNYAKQLVETLHPELKPIDEKELETVTIDNVLANGIYNDLAIKCYGRVMIFVEQQSSYNPNIAARLMMYAVDTIKNSIVMDPNINLFSSRKAALPAIEFFCICSYRRQEHHPDYETFGDADGYLHSRVKMIYPNVGEQNIISQYVNFAQGVTDILKEKTSKEQKIELMQAYIGKCIDTGVLNDYLKNHRWEVMDIMDILFDQDFVTERMIIEAKNDAKAEGLAEGKAEGKVEGIAEGKAEGLTAGKLEAYSSMVSRVISKQGISFEQAITLLDVPAELIEEIKERLSITK